MLGPRVMVAVLAGLLSLAGRPALAEMPLESTSEGSPAEQDPSDDAFDFGEDLTTPSLAPPSPSPFAITGFFRSEEGLWVQRLGKQPLGKARQSLDLLGTFRSGIWSAALAGHAEYDAAYLVDRAGYDRATLDAYEWLVDLRRAWLAAELGQFDVTVGYHVLNWGEGDAISLADVTNPRDFREPGLADLEDLRLPALMTRIGWFAGYHRVEIAWIHDGFFGYRTPPLGPFSPLPAIIESSSGLDLGPLLAGRELSFRHRQDRFSWSNQQLLARWSWRGPGLDVAVFGGLALDLNGVVKLPETAEFLAPEIKIELDHRRYGLLGFSGARPVGDWLLKWEAVVSFARPWNTVADSGGGFPAIGIETSGAFGGMLGIQYGGIANTQVVLEMAQTLPFRTDLDYLIPPDLPQIALRVSHLALRDTLSFLGALSTFGWKAELGWIARAELGWRFMDGLELGLGFIHYQPADATGPISGLDRHDRVSLKFRWDFQIH